MKKGLFMVDFETNITFNIFELFLIFKERLNGKDYLILNIFF